MNSNNDPMPPEARKAVRLAIATHLTHALLTKHLLPEVINHALDFDIVERSYVLADLLIAKAGL